jgi:hypothetical protein
MVLSQSGHSFPAKTKDRRNSASSQLDGNQSQVKNNMFTANFDFRKFLPAVASLALLAGEAKALTVSPSSDFNALANFLLVDGWDPVPGSVSGTLAGANAIGTFDNAADIGLTNGVLLTTGTVFNALGPNTSGSTSGPGALSSLSFDFVAVSPGISWRYVFASEE